MKWIKSTLTFYYFNSFIDIPKEKIKENTEIYTKAKFKDDIYKAFKKDPKNLIITTTNDISEEEMFPEIVKTLLEIQVSSSNETSQFNFKFGEFVNICLEVPIQQSNLEYVINQIEDTKK